MLPTGRAVGRSRLTVMKDPKSQDAILTVVLLVGVYEGVMPFVAKLFGWHPVLALPLLLPDPTWWIVSSSVIVVALTLLMGMDADRKRHQPGA